ncbi:unnamed protein product [Lymnaea stagnalis]|uniref:C-type lectin domain-containing protein n=1 Tax=Lymnaea stagnalis TaxID=6523 RepID=A0AAV2H691_LYMST
MFGESRQESWCRRELFFGVVFFRMAGVKSWSLMALFVFSLAVGGDVYGSLVLEVSPRSVEVGRTRWLQVNCSYAPEMGQGMDTLVSLVVSGLRDPVTGVGNSIGSVMASDAHNPQDIASMSVFSSQEVTALSNLTVKTSGYIAPRGASYLGFVMDNPNFGAPDTYKCTAHGIRQTGQPMVMSENVKVQFANSSLNEESLRQLENIESVVEEAKGKILAIGRRQSEQYRNLTDDITALSSTQIRQDLKIGALRAEIEAYENMSNHLISIVSGLKKLRVEDDSKVQSELATLEDQNKNASSLIAALGAKVQQYQNTSVEMNSLLSSLDSLKVTVGEVLKKKNDTSVCQHDPNNTTIHDVTPTPRTLTFIERTEEFRRLKDAILRDLYIVSPTFGAFGASFYVVPKAPRPLPYSWIEGKCKRVGGYLVEINDRNEYNFVVNFIKDLPQAQIQTYFTGMQYASLEKPGPVSKGWIYARTKKPVSFTEWGEGEPNNLGWETCLTLEKSKGWKMNDVTCSYKNDMSFVCEISNADFYSFP